MEQPTDRRAGKDHLLWTGLFLVLAFFSILTRVWITEDAYISFRYIDNLFAGNGLVFNAGERVEGFTHPTWLLCLILVRSLGIHEHQGAILLGVLFSLCGIALALRWKARNASPLFLFPAILASHDGFRDFSTSGLEFSLTFFLLVALLTLTYGKTLDSPFLLGTIVSLLYHTRPEMGMLIPYYFVWRLVETRRIDTIWSLRYALAVLTFAGSYHLFRYIYFNDVLPNTFYAKSGASARYADGLVYLGHFLFYSKFFILSGAAVMGLAVFNRSRGNTLPAWKVPWRELILAGIVGHYIIRVGGDFMGFRLLLPAFVILWFVLDDFASSTTRALSPITVRFLNLLLLALSSAVFALGNSFPVLKFGVVNERMAFSHEFDRSGNITADLYSGLADRSSGIRYRWYETGLKFRALQTCLQTYDFWITNSITDAKCMKEGVGLGYFGVAAGPDVKIVDELGLTDREIAKSGRTSAHQRVGHERTVSLEQLLDKRVAFCSMDDGRYDRLMETDFGVVVRLDRDFLMTLGESEYHRRIAGLKQLKRDLLSTSSHENVQLLRRIGQAERVWGQRIEDLPDSAEHSAALRQKARCWQSL